MQIEDVCVSTYPVLGLAALESLLNTLHGVAVVNVRLLAGWGDNDFCTIRSRRSDLKQSAMEKKEKTNPGTEEGEWVGGVVDG